MSSFPTCQVCHQQFSLKGPAPYLLPCLHAICETCQTSATGGLVSCKLCDRDVNLTETSLQKDSVREKEILYLTVQHHPDLVLCTHEEDGNQAVCWCKECEDFLCENCQMVHNSFKATRRHDVLDIGELGPGSLEEDLYCKIHPKYILDAWDEGCCILTCGKCRLEEHAQHKAIKVEEAAETARKEVANLQKDAQSAVGKHGAQIESSAKDLQKSDEKYSLIPHKISQTMNSLRTVIDQREKELQIELQQHKDMVREDLVKKKHTSEACHQKCQTISDYISKALKYSSNHDIMSLKPTLQSKTEDSTSCAPASLQEGSLPTLNTDGLEKIKSDLSGFCTITWKDGQVMHIKAKGSSKAEHFASRECEDLREEVEQLKKEIQTLRGKVTQEKMEELHGPYRLKENDNDDAFLLYCTAVEFSKTRYNADKVHISADGWLINTSQANPPYSDQRLKKYSGTSSTVPLHHSLSTQYFEVKSLVVMVDTLPDNKLLLKIGLSSKEGQDINDCLVGEHPFYTLSVQNCTDHNSICRITWSSYKELRCLPDTLEDIPGTSAFLHYGVVYNSARNRIAFLDVEERRIISRVRNIDGSVTLWPMFGVFYTGAFVSMSLVVGSDIDMAEWKKALILKSLSY